jgi:hypothetical protein
MTQPSNSPADDAGEQPSVESALQRLAALIEEGENSGTGTAYTVRQWEERMRKLRDLVPDESTT